MKTLICNLLIIVIISQFTETLWVFYFTDEEAECIKKLNADEDQIRDLYLRHVTPENDTQFNHFIECCWKKLGYQTENGDIDYEKLKNSLILDRRFGIDNPLILKELNKLTSDAVSKCENNHALLKADTAAETAVKVQNCIGKNFYQGVDNLRGYT